MKIIDLTSGPKVNVFVDKVDEFKKDHPWADVTPVDTYGNFVPLDKTASDNLDKMEESIQENYNLSDCAADDMPTKTTYQAEVEGGEV